MKSRLLLALIAIAGSTTLRAAELPKPPAPAERVMLLVATAYEADSQYLILAPHEGGPTIRLLLGPEPRKKSAFLYSHRGELVTVAVKTGSQGIETISAVTPFDGPRGLRSPRAYLFDGTGEQKVGPQTFTTLKLTRLGQSREVAIPNRAVPGGGGKPALDPVLLERVRSLKPGDLVEVEVQPGAGKNVFTLVDLDAYREPRVAEFVKLDTLKEGGKSYPAIVLNVDDQPKTIAFPTPPAGGAALSPTAAALQPAARKLKPGIFVRVTARDDGAHETVRELRIDGEIRPGSNKRLELISTFVAVDYEPSSGEGYVYFRGGSHRPEDELFEKGIQRAAYSKSEVSRLKLGPTQVEQIKAALNQRLNTDENRVKPQEQQQWIKAFGAFVAARDDAERARIEQQLLWAGQELSVRYRKDVESRHTILRALLDGPQLEEVRKLGLRSQGPSAD